MKLTQPVSGQTFDIGGIVRFEGTAPAGTARVTFTADGQFPLEDGLISPLTTGEFSFSMSRRFLAKGTRQISAKAFKADGTSLGSVTVSVAIDIPRIGNYVPPLASLDVLAEVIFRLEDARTVRKVNAFIGSKALFKLPDGELYMDSDLDLDTDGSKVGTDATHQSATSISDPNGKPIDANSVAYFVLPSPGGGAGGKWFKDLGVSWGDIAAIIYGTQVSFAFFADGGPQAKVGEASIQVHRELGTLRQRADGSIRDVGIDKDVISIIFPGSGKDLVKGSR